MLTHPGFLLPCCTATVVIPVASCLTYYSLTLWLVLQSWPFLVHEPLITWCLRHCSLLALPLHPLLFFLLAQFSVAPHSPPVGPWGAPGAVFVPLLHLHSFPSCPASSRLTGSNVTFLASRFQSARVTHPIAAPLFSSDVSERHN